MPEERDWQPSGPEPEPCDRVINERDREEQTDYEGV